MIHKKADRIDSDTHRYVLDSTLAIVETVIEKLDDMDDKKYNTEMKIAYFIP